MIRTKTFISWLLQVLVAISLGWAAIQKFTGSEETIRVFQSLDMEPTGRYLIAALETMVAVLLLLPPSIPWGAILGWGIMTGAIIAHTSRLGIGLESDDTVILMMTANACFNWIACSAILLLRRKQIAFIDKMLERKPNEAS